MITLCGFSASNYYNKAKLALLEKGVAFEERLVYPSVQMPATSASPMGKVPYLLADGLSLSESQAIIEYLEGAFPQPHLYPSDPAAAAKCRELIHVIELYLELPARRLYPEAFFGGKVSDDTKRQVSAQIAKAARALEVLVRFDPFVAGAEFSYADCAAYVHLPLVTGAARAVLEEDPLAEIAGLQGYLKFIALRPHAQRVNADRKAGLDAFVAMRKRG
jgi:glutathione S-transferase